jgi:hypothetical protein
MIVWRLILRVTVADSFSLLPLGVGVLPLARDDVGGW